MIGQTGWVSLRSGEKKLRAFFQTPLRAEEAIWGVWLAFFGAALLGYISSFGELEEFFKHHPDMAFKMEPGMYRFFDFATWAYDSMRVFKGNLLIFVSFSLLALRYPRLAFYGLLALTAKTGLMAAPYNEVVMNLIPYTLIAIVTGLGEMAAYALSVSKRWLTGALLLFAWAWLETYLIYWGL